MRQRCDWQLGALSVLGIDPSLNATGLTLINYLDSRLLGSTVIGNSNLRGIERLVYNNDKLTEFVKPSASEILVVAIEDYAYSAIGLQKLQMAEWMGILKLTLHQLLQDYAHDVYLVPPTVLKKFITGDGRAPEQILALEGYKRFGWEFNTPHEIDACGLAEFGRRVHGYLNDTLDWKENLTLKQQEAVNNFVRKLREMQ